MTTFWLAAGAMILLALLFLLLPLLRGPQRDGIDRDRLNTAVIREQLAELAAEHQAGRLDDDSWQAARRDLERELLDDLGSDTASAPSRYRSGRWMALLLVLCVPAAAVGLYRQLGTGAAPAPVAAAPTATGKPHPMEALVAKLAARLQEQPDNLEGWVMLGRSYAVLKRYPDAARAYARAHELAGDQPELLVDWADVLIMASNGVFTDQAGELLKKALEKNPDDVKGLWLMGHWYARHGDEARAIDYWRRAAARLPPDSEDLAVLNRQIRDAGGEPVRVAATSPATRTTTAAGGGALRVHVTLDPSLRDQVSPDDTLFVYARAVRGPRMPLAIVRRRVADLPLDVILDDSLAMSPAMVLSKFPQVTLTARISKSGQATAASGDLEGMVTPVDSATDSVIDIVIDQRRP